MGGGGWAKKNFCKAKSAEKKVVQGGGGCIGKNRTSFFYYPDPNFDVYVRKAITHQKKTCTIQWPFYSNSAHPYPGI